jgi:hypothetical protein
MQTRELADWRLPLYYVHSVMMVCSALHANALPLIYPLLLSYVAKSTFSPARVARYSYLCSCISPFSPFLYFPDAICA